MITQIRKITSSHYRIRLQAPEISRRAKPGQFVHVRVSEGLDPLLRRPLSFHRIGKDWFELLFQVVGKGTKILAEKKKGDRLDIIGPLGNGFNAKRTTQNAQRILIAGGMGVAPLLALAEELKTQNAKLKTVILIGAKSKKDILCRTNFKKLGFEVQIATDDGSQGYHGLVTDLFKNLLFTVHRSPVTIFACGPEPMLREVIKIAKRKKIKAQLSFENFMGCGIGACLGCAIKTRKGYQRVCKDGPVFEAGEF